MILLNGLELEGISQKATYDVTTRYVECDILMQKKGELLLLKHMSGYIQIM